MFILGFLDHNVFKVSMKSKGSIVSFRIFIGLLSLCLEDLSIDVCWTLKSPNIIVFQSISPYVC